MIRTRLVALTLALAAISSTSAHAFPHFGIHRNPSAAVQPDSRIAIVLYNKSSTFRDVKVDGRVYTVLAHTGLAIKAPAGTPVYAESMVPLHRRGDVLFTIREDQRDKTVVID
jgi:murein DD-endopeptidase MepM/ murein hydrolase activator NlpD